MLKFNNTLLLKELLVIAVFFFITFIPSIIYVLFSLPSLTVGLVVALFLSFLLLFAMWSGLNVRVQRRPLRAVCMIFFIIIISRLPTLDVEAPKLFGSIVTVALMAFFVSRFCAAIDVRNVDLYKSFKFVFMSLLVCGFFSLFVSLGYGGFEKFPKAVFVFYEPSHFAVLIGPFYLVYFWFCGVRGRLFSLSAISLLAVLLPNATLVAFVALSLLLWVLSVPLVLKAPLVLLAAFCFVLSMGSDWESAKYFQERLFMSADTSNLSALVYLQGWEDALGALVQTNGVGLGFQRAGIQNAGEVGEKIHDITGFYKNRLDGGFVASKLISEFGVVGVVLVLFILRKVGRAVLSLNRRGLTKNEEVWSVVVISFLVELFARGMGYFTVGVILFVCGLWSRARPNEG